MKSASRMVKCFVCVAILCSAADSGWMADTLPDEIVKTYSFDNYEFQLHNAGGTFDFAFGQFADTDGDGVYGENGEGFVEEDIEQNETLTFDGGAPFGWIELDFDPDTDGWNVSPVLFPAMNRARDHGMAVRPDTASDFNGANRLYQSPINCAVKPQ